MVETLWQGVPIEKVENTENTLQKPEKKFWKDETHLQQIKKNEAQERHDEEIAMNIKLLNNEFRRINPKLEVSYQGDNKYSLLYPDAKNPNQYFWLVDNFEIKDSLDPSSAYKTLVIMMKRFNRKKFGEEFSIPEWFDWLLDEHLDYNIKEGWGLWEFVNKRLLDELLQKDINLMLDELMEEINNNTNEHSFHIYNMNNIKVEKWN